MQSTVERVLYITLLSVFVGVGFGVYALVQLNHKIDQELTSIEQNAKQRTEQIQDLKNQSDKNTRYLECLLDLHAQGLAPDNEDCKQQTTQPGAPVDRSPFTLSAPAGSSSTSPSATPPPVNSGGANGAEPNKPVTQQVQDFVSGIIKAVGL